MITLGLFFDSDYDPNWPSMKSWIEDPNTDGDEVSSNITFEKKDKQENYFFRSFIS